MMNKRFSPLVAETVLHRLRQSGLPLRYDFASHRLAALDGAGNELLQFRLPLSFPPPGQVRPDHPMRYVLLLIQSGNCALGYFEGGVNLDHKVFRAYMVRKKQGKSQIKHLKTKGKSRAGSRVRLAETLEFFEHINERLQAYFSEHEVDRIAISCSKILIPYLFNSKVATPFDKRDERLYKIPRHVHTPIYEVMMDTHAYLMKGELMYQEQQQPLVDELLGLKDAAEEE